MDDATEWKAGVRRPVTGQGGAQSVTIRREQSPDAKPGNIRLIIQGQTPQDIQALLGNLGKVTLPEGIEFAGGVNAEHSAATLQANFRLTGDAAELDGDTNQGRTQINALANATIAAIRQYFPDVFSAPTCLRC